MPLTRPWSRPCDDTSIATALAPAARNCASSLVQHRGVGRRVRRRRERADEAVAERAEHRRAAAARVERLRDPLRARRLAVGAGDADHPQRLRRAAVDEVGDGAQPRLQALDAGVAAPATSGPSANACASHSTAAAPRAIASGMKRAAVGVRPGIRGERVAGLDAAAVGRDAARERAEPREQRGHVEVERARRRHGASRLLADLAASAAAGSRCRPARRSARRACAARRRSTFENTGAATAPP